MLPEVYYTAGVVFAVFEVLHKGIVKPLLAGPAKKVSFTLGSSMYSSHVSASACQYSSLRWERGSICNVCSYPCSDFFTPGSCCAQRQTDSCGCAPR